MNTLLPYEGFPQSAECLDDNRLGKQRGEVITILKALSGEGLHKTNGAEHTAVKMWRGHTHYLVMYGMAVCIEWQYRGNPDNTLKKMRGFLVDNDETEPPEWLGDEALHEAHRSFLLRSQPSHYRRFWPDLPDDLAMVWPRSPEKQRTSQDAKQKEKNIARAKKMKERALLAIEEAHDAAIKAGLDPETLEPIADVEVDPELAAL